MKLGDKVFFIKNSLIQQSKVVHIINDHIGIRFPVDDDKGILYVDKTWIFKSQREAERRAKKYGWDVKTNL